MSEQLITKIRDMLNEEKWTRALISSYSKNNFLISSFLLHNQIGNLDAKLDSIAFTNSNNDAIEYSYTGITENDVINDGDAQTFTITVKFNDAYTQMPADTTSSVVMNLTYV